MSSLMPHTAVPPVVHDLGEQGAVQVRVDVSATQKRVWAAITQRTVAAKWFGDFSRDLSPDLAGLRLEFGDGDFFALEDIKLQPPSHLHYGWRFLGTGPRDAIELEIVAQGNESCQVIITDRDPLRSEDMVEQLKMGWTDFLGRLQRFLATGKISRYDWRRDFDGWIELSVSRERAWDLLFGQENLARWLPLNPLPGGPGIRSLSVHSSGESWINRAEWRDGFELALDVRSPDWRQSTSCCLEVLPRAGASALMVRHTGWDKISSDPAYCKQQRHEFADRWIAALRDAQQFVEQPV